MARRTAVRASATEHQDQRLAGPEADALQGLPERDAGIRALNLAYGFGFLLALTGNGHTRADRAGLSPPALDQFLAGWKAGKAIWALPDIIDAEHQP